MFYPRLRNWEAKLHSRGSPTKGSDIRSAPQQRGTKSEVAASRPKTGQKCHISPAFSWIPNIAEKNQNWLPHPSLLGPPKEGGSAMSPLRSRGSPTEADGNKSGPQKGGSAMSPLRSRGSPNKGTQSKVAQKSAEVLRNPYVLGGPRKGVQKAPARPLEKNPHSGGP